MARTQPWSARIPAWNLYRNPHFYSMLVADGVLFLLAYLGAHWIRFDFDLDFRMVAAPAWYLPLLVLCKFLIFYGHGLYRGMWRYTGVRDFWRLARACFLSLLVAVALVLYTGWQGFSRAVLVLDALLTFLLAGSLRVFIRSYFARRRRQEAGLQPSCKRRRAAILGAGVAGQQIVQELLANPYLHYEPLVLLDDDPRKIGRSIHNVPVWGPLETLPQVAEALEIDEILIAMPSVAGNPMRRIIQVCESSRVPYKTLPALAEVIDGRVSVNQLRQVDYQDLLGRKPVHLDLSHIQHCVQDRVVLVTGAGGSVGSELCRQLIHFQPSRLILVDACEENLFHIQMELHHERRFRQYETILARVQNRDLMQRVFEIHQPSLVLHAAAYKHVPLVEHNPWEAIFNNVLASQVAMELSLLFGVERFVLVSSDKAVEPSNVMGASKCLAEMILGSLSEGDTKFMAVRFGNVVGSSGSVIPLFQRQISHGGPVTVTHPEASRFFMTIPEASQLILQAGALGEGGEIFMLEMGTPVRILQLAEDLIRMAGKEPGEDIEIVFTGLREGEKLHEQLVSEWEQLEPTSHPKIFRVRTRRSLPSKMAAHERREWLNWHIEELVGLARRMDAEGIRRKLQKIVPGYRPELHRRPEPEVTRAAG